MIVLYCVMLKKGGSIVTYIMDVEPALLDQHKTFKDLFIFLNSDNNVDDYAHYECDKFMEFCSANSIFFLNDKVNNVFFTYKEASIRLSELRSWLEPTLKDK